VATGKTTHAESVKITFDPRAVSYGRLLQIYFSVAHDPTELDRQGPDSGSQYRSEIWYVDDMQKHIAEAYIAQLTAAHAFPAPIATRVEAYGGFFRAEDEHQDYLIRNLDQRYIADFDLPRIAALKRLYPDSYTETPVLIR
jgi:peptide-methionine (S)-S-oxide reductase